MATGKMYDCDVKVPYKVQGKREYRWVTRPAAKVFKDSEIRCCHCHGEVVPPSPGRRAWSGGSRRAQARRGC